MEVIINVAEKPSVAKGIAEILGRGVEMRKTESKSQYNPVWQFYFEYNQQKVIMIVTSVLGHIKTYEFPETCKDWKRTPFTSLFSVQLQKHVIDTSKKVVQNIKFHSKSAVQLNLWLDCDREGEAIAFDVAEACKESNKKIKVKRAVFSEVTDSSIRHAIENLAELNLNMADAVNVRQEVDLRIGACFTRYQTLLIQEAIPSFREVVSYGPCQFPTLGFIVERQLQIEEFVPENYFYLDCKITKQLEGKEVKVDFAWEKYRLFDEICTLAMYQAVIDEGKGKVIRIVKKQREKRRPIPLNTVTFEQLASKKLHISAHDAIDRAEKLYNQGLISYPRTETQIYAPSIDLKKLIQQQVESPNWGDFAKRLQDPSSGLYQGPYKGSGNDKAHPPIHPVRLPPGQLAPELWAVYELVSRHFLASVSKDAIGHETTVIFAMGPEKFTSSGLIVKDKGWLEIFTYEKWSDKQIPDFLEGENITPKSLTMEKGKTVPPKYLAEEDLIGKMDANGIGTDATIQEHIKKVQERKYAYKISNIFKATPLGVALVNTYKDINVPLYKPFLRAQMERDMKEIADGKMTRDIALQRCLKEMQKIFEDVSKKKERMSTFLKTNAFKKPEGLPHEENKGNENQPSNENVNKPQVNGNAEVCNCSQCGGRMRLCVSRKGLPFLGCKSFPNCKNGVFFPKGVTNATVLDEECKKCQQQNNHSFLVKLDFAPDVKQALEKITNSNFTFCLAGCDAEILKELNKLRFPNGAGGSGNNYPPGNQQNKRFPKNTGNNNTGNNNTGNNNTGNNNTGNNNGNNGGNKSGNKKNSGKQSRKQVPCKVCGVVGRHPKGSQCEGMRKNKKAQENQNNESPQNQ